MTNPVFYLKICALSMGLLISRHLQKSFDRKSDKPIDAVSVRLAYLSLALWIITLSAGRFLAYTHTTLLASRFY